jgi:hypothetical protein
MYIGVPGDIILRIVILSLTFSKKLIVMQVFLRPILLAKMVLVNNRSRVFVGSGWA